MNWKGGRERGLISKRRGMEAIWSSIYFFCFFVSEPLDVATCADEDDDEEEDDADADGAAVVAAVFAGSFASLLLSAFFEP
jgi:hypothetical protein